MLFAASDFIADGVRSYAMPAFPVQGSSISYPAAFSSS